MIYTITNEKDKYNLISAIMLLSESKKWEVSVKVKPDKRSVPANKLYWLWINCIANDLGDNPNDVHDIFRLKFLPYSESFKLGEKLISLTSTTSLDTKEFSEYLDRIRAFASVELGISLPDPSHPHFSEFYDQFNKG